MPKLNPRPAWVDADGRIFEADGTRLVVPGLEPETVLQGLREIEAGRTRPIEDVLREIRAKREGRDG